MLQFIDRTTAAPSCAAKPMEGLSEAVPQVSPRYVYDTLGCHLFAAITELPEYDPTRLEREICRQHAAQMADSTAILTECSDKYAPEDFCQLLEDGGFHPLRSWLDATGGFMVCHARCLVH